MAEDVPMLWRKQQSTSATNNQPEQLFLFFIFSFFLLPIGHHKSQ